MLYFKLYVNFGLDEKCNLINSVLNFLGLIDHYSSGESQEATEQKKKKKMMFLWLRR